MSEKNESVIDGLHNGSGREAEVILWSDESCEAADLASSLREEGYSVEQIFTTGREPIARLDLCVVSGYGSIAAQLLRRVR